MDFIFTSSPDHAQIAEMKAMYATQDIISIEQYPGFALASEPEQKVVYMLSYLEGKLHSYTCIKIKKRVIATIMYGPVINSLAEYVVQCKELIRYCKKNGVLIIRIFPPYMSPGDSALLSASTDFKFIQSDQAFNWATLRLHINAPIDDLLKGFSENHRRNIKKAQKLNLHTAIISDRAEIDLFSEQYTKMYESRSLAVSLDQVRDSFQRTFTFFKKNSNGIFLAVRSETDGLIGGLCICYQGDSAFYHKGYSHPDHRSLPINHLAFYEAIKLAKENGRKFFDFGGYGQNLREDDPVHAINRFKDGFSGELTVYPQTMTIYTTPVSKLLLDIYRRIRKADV